MDDDLVKIPYATDTLVAVLPPTHPLARHTPIQLQALANEDFLLLEKQSYQHKLIMRTCREYGFEPKVAFTDERIENLIELVIEGMGVALMMKQLALYLASPKIAIVDILPTVPTQICLCYLKEAEISEAARHFVRCAASQ